ncbi:MAG: AsmA family protein [Elusimicrobia bacterium]|nr:AsmA family protein [Elusimicrobiota bacterium]
MPHRAGVLLKAVLLAAVIVAALSACMAFVLKGLLPPERLREMVVAHLEKALDRDVRLSGVSLGLVVGLAVEGLEVSEEGGFEEGTFAAAGTARLRLRWLPLLQKRVVAEAVSLHDARFHLERRMDGTLNLPGSATRKKRPRKTGAGRRPIDLDVRYVEVSNGRFTYHNARKKKGWDISGIDVGASGFAVNGPFPVDVSMHAKWILPAPGVSGAGVPPRSKLESGLPAATLEGDVMASGTLDLAALDPEKMSAEVSVFRTQVWGIDAAASGTIRRFKLPLFRIDAVLSKEGRGLGRAKLDIAVEPGRKVEEGRRKKALAMRLSATVPPAGASMLARLARLPEGFPRLPETRVEGAVRLEGKDLDIRSFSAESPLGSMSVSGRILGLGRKARPFLDASAAFDVPAFESEDVKFLRRVPRGLSLPASRVNARLRVADREIEIGSLSVELGPSTVEFSGRLLRDASGRTTLRLHAGRVSLDAGQVAGIAPKTQKLGLSGRVQGTLSIGGTLKAPSVSGDFELLDLSGQFKGVQVSRLSGRGTLAGRDLMVGHLEGEAAGGRVTVKDLAVTGLGRGLKVSLEADMTRLDLERLLSPKPPGPRGQGTGSAGAPQQAFAASRPGRKPPPPMALQGKVRVGEVAHPFFSAKDLKLEWDLKDVTKDLSEINGASTVTVASGRFRSLDALASRSTAAKVLLMPLLVIQKVQRLPGLNMLPDLTEVSFATIRGAYVFRDGVMEVKECRLSSLTLSIEAGGTVDFHGDRLALDVAAKVLKLPLPLKFSVTGTLNDPKVRPDAVGSVLSPLLDPAKKLIEFLSPK